MDGWLGDLTQFGADALVVGALVLFYFWIEAAIALRGKRDDVANWQQHLEHQRIQLTARRMAREVEEEERLDRMWRQA